MIYKFDRYLLKVIFIHFIATLFFLLTIDFIVQFSDHSSKIDHNFPAWLLIYTLLLDIPNKIIEYTPASILIATIMGLGQLSAQNEITIIRTSGISRLRLSLTAILFSVFLGILSLIISELIAPITNHKSAIITAQATGQPIDISFKNGLWIQSNDSIVHIDKLNNNGTLNALTFYTLDQTGTLTIQQSKKATFSQNHWKLSGNTQRIITQKQVLEGQAQSTWNSKLTPQSIARYARTDNASTITELINQRNFLKANQLNTDSPTLKLWQRILLPLTTLTMVLLALPFAFNTQRNGFGGRLVAGIILGVAYYFVQGILAKIILLYNLPPFIGAMMPIIIFIIPPLFLLQRN